MKKFFIISLSLFFFFVSNVSAQDYKTNCVANQPLPDSSCTPGAVLTTSTKIICVDGYTESVRKVSPSTKKEVFRRYGIPYEKRAEYQVDHLIALGLGGSNDISNLWPEKYDLDYGVAAKMRLESYFYRLMCSGKMAPAEIQAKMADNWLEQYKLIIESGQVHFVSRPTSTQLITTANKSKFLDRISLPRCGDCAGEIIGCELDTEGCLWNVQIKTDSKGYSFNNLVAWFKKYYSFGLAPGIKIWNLIIHLYK